MLTAKNERNGKQITTPKQAIGTPLFVHFRRKRGARPSSDRLYNDRVAQYVHVLPAEKMLVTRSAFTTDGRALIPRFVIAITYGEAAAFSVSLCVRTRTS